MPHEWTFPATYIDNYDGDTITLLLDQGFRTQRAESVRLNGVDTPELRGGTDLTKRLGYIARDHVRTLCEEATSLVFISHRWSGKYGRPIGDLLINDDFLLSQALIDAHLGVPYDGGSRAHLRAAHEANAHAYFDPAPTDE